VQEHGIEWSAIVARPSESPNRGGVRPAGPDWEAYGALRAPHAMEAPWSGMVVNALATLLNITWGGILIRQGRRGRSAAVAADGWHLLTTWRVRSACWRASP
jgi:hypothetical protein